MRRGYCKAVSLPAASKTTLIRDLLELVGHSRCPGELDDEKERWRGSGLDIKTLQRFTSAHASIHNHFNHDRHLNRRARCAPRAVTPLKILLRRAHQP